MVDVTATVPVTPQNTPVATPTASPVASIPTGSNLTSIPTKTIQTNLGVASDGIYGSQTTAAVKAFQTANGLVADGIFGTKTQQAYDNKYNGGSPILSTDSIHAQGAADSSALDSKLAQFDSSYIPPASSNGNLNSTGSGGTTGPTSGGAPGETATTWADGTSKTDANGNQVADPNASTGGVDISATSTDPFISQLNTLSQNSDSSTKMLIQQATMSAANAEATATANSQKYQEGLQALGIETGQAQATPDILASSINAAKGQLADKISTLESAKAKAISDATTARDSNDLKTLNEKMSYVKQVEAQEKQALTDFQNNLSNTVGTKAVSNAKAMAGTLYDEMNDPKQPLSPEDQVAFINEVSKQTGISAGILLNEVGLYKQSQTKSTLANENAQATLDNKLNPKSGGSKGGTDGSYKYTTEDVSTYANLLNQGGKGPNGTTYNARGTDTYVDPEAYIAVYKDWVSNGGTPKGFLKQFPVTNVNPESYSKLPAGLQPKTKATSGGRSS